MYTFFQKNFIRRATLIFSILRIFLLPLFFLSLFPLLSELWIIRLAFSFLCLMALALGTPAFYFSLVGMVLYLKSRDPHLKIYLYSTLFQALMILSLVLTFPATSSPDRAPFLDFILGGPFFFQSLAHFGGEFLHLLKDPSYFIPFVQ